MIDEDFRTWLIEVNTNPSLALNNKGMKHILPKMFSDLFTITLDPVFERMSADERDNIWESTHFDLLWSRTRAINKRRNVKEGIYPVKELDPRAPRTFHIRRNQIRKNIGSMNAGDLEKLQKHPGAGPVAGVHHERRSTALGLSLNEAGASSQRKGSLAPSLPECPHQPQITPTIQMQHRTNISRHGGKRN